MLSLARDLARTAARAWIGRTVSVLFEQRQENGRLTGLTEHYVRTHCSAPTHLIGRIAEAVPTDEADGALLADL